jgi:hypothetical protein
MVNSGANPISRSKHHDAAQAVNPKVIARNNDARQGDEWISDKYDTHPTATCQRKQGEYTPHRPANVQ